ncbi:MAG TPA: phosphohydrolase [Oribacterium sp.]|jgi:uncharacterized protein|nr:phosphohydrolase [Oribacterium sp.]
MVLDDNAIQFAEQYKNITANQTYAKLKSVPRHGSTNTYDHSVRVARMAYSMAKILGVDPDSAARVGLLHDFCLVDYHKDDKDIHGGRWYCFYHPEDAVINSEKEGYYLSYKEKCAIWSHMFPLATSIPTSRLGYILTISDKVVATQESFANASEFFDRFKFLLNGGHIRTARVKNRNHNHMEEFK